MLNRLKEKDIRWELLQNEPQKTNHKLYKSLWKFIVMKIEQRDEEETISENENASESSKESTKKLRMLGKKGKPENQI